MPAYDRRHYTSHGYPARAKRVRQAAEADPSVVCWRCGEPRRPNDPWQAGHVVDGDSSGPLRPEHRSCNIRAGNRKDREPRSQSW